MTPFSATRRKNPRPLPVMKEAQFRRPTRDRKEAVESKEMSEEDRRQKCLRLVVDASDAVVAADESAPRPPSSAATAAAVDD